MTDKSNSERRSRKRVAVRVPVAVSPPKSAPVQAFTRDLSSSGIFLYTDSNILEGSSLEMILMLPPEVTQGQKRWVCCQASVIRVEQNPGGPFGVAAQIRHIADLPELQT